MKKIIFALFCLTFWSGCVKEGKKSEDEPSNQCPTINALSVPTEVLTAFQMVYPKQTVLIWFKNAPTGYAAFFINGGNQRKLAEFTGAGIFISEKIDIDYDGNFEDSSQASVSKTSIQCECVVPN